MATNVSVAPLSWASMCLVVSPRTQPVSTHKPGLAPDLVLCGCCGQELAKAFSTGAFSTPCMRALLVPKRPSVLCRTCAGCAHKGCIQLSTRYHTVWIRSVRYCCSGADRSLATGSRLESTVQIRCVLLASAAGHRKSSHSPISSMTNVDLRRDPATTEAICLVQPDGACGSHANTEYSSIDAEVVGLYIVGEAQGCRQPNLQHPIMCSTKY